MNASMTLRALLSASVLSVSILLNPALAGSNSSQTSNSGFSRPTMSAPAPAPMTAPSAPRVSAPAQSTSTPVAPSNSGFSRPNTNPASTAPQMPMASNTGTAHLPPVAAPPAGMAPAPRITPQVTGALAGAAAAGGAAAAYQSYQNDRAPAPPTTSSQPEASRTTSVPSYTTSSPSVTYHAPRQETRTVVERETVYVPSQPQVVYVPTPGLSYQPPITAPAYTPRPAVQPAPLTNSGASFSWIWWMLGLGFVAAGVFVLFNMLRNR